MSRTYEPIQTQTVGTATPSVTFSSIPQTYTDLVCVVSAKAASAAYDLYLQFNGDTGNNYSWTALSGTGSSAVSNRNSNGPAIQMDNYGSVRTTDFGVNISHIMNYSNSTTYKTVLARANAAASGVDINVGLWRNTAAVTSITLYINSFAVGSTFTLYGIKAE
jgi:hypothetical protein